MICIMHEGTPYGHLTIGTRPATPRQIGTITGVGEKEATKLIEELEDAGVFSRNDGGVIFSRRMVRDWDYEIKHRNYGKRGGNPELIKARPGTVPSEDRVVRLKPDKNPTLFRQIFEEAEGSCELCGVQLTRETPYAANSYQLDHIKEVKDGGTNDRDNLRAVCRKCNMSRNLIPSIDVPHNQTIGDPVKGSSGGRDKFLDTDSESEAESERKRERETRAQAPAARPRQAKIHSDWFPDADGIKCAKEVGITDVAETIGKFVDYYTANGKPMVDWDAAWRVWCSREPDIRRNGK